MILDSRIFALRDSLTISRKFLTSLKLFVKEKYLRSRRAPLASTKTLKVGNGIITTINATNVPHCCEICNLLVSWNLHRASDV